MLAIVSCHDSIYVGLNAVCYQRRIRLTGRQSSAADGKPTVITPKELGKSKIDRNRFDFFQSSIEDPQMAFDHIRPVIEADCQLFAFEHN